VRGGVPGNAVIGTIEEDAEGTTKTQCQQNGQKKANATLKAAQDAGIYPKDCRLRHCHVTSWTAPR